MIEGRAVHAPQSFFITLHKVPDGVAIHVIA
jgi:hypothetical protein